MDFRTMSRSVAERVIELRRDFHMYPEESFAEFRTTERICEELDALAIPYRRFEPTGLIAEIRGAESGRTVALRADIDALSIQEQTDLPFKSLRDGMMHACGHDAHAAMLLGAAMLLNSIRAELSGTVKLIFQPAEEIVEGAKAVIRQGGLDGVDMIFGLHIEGESEKGVVMYMPGPVCAASDFFRIKLYGKSGHAASPQAAVDATVAAAAIVMNLQTMVSRELPPDQAALCTVGKLNSGSRFNNISGYAEMEGTCRCYDPDVHRTMPEIMERIVRNTAAAYRCRAELEYTASVEPLINNPKALAYLKAAAAKIVDRPENLMEVRPQMGSEDFSEYTVLVPGAYGFVGGGTAEVNHSDRIVFDEDSFRTGVALYAQLAYDFLMG